ncbi:MAG: pimeloyl-ACP methyl ester carboxylesterase [Hyphomicrobiaceae bacterium]|jgi:pimeloyl-ACP methyl ester carboxylesterase
MPRIHSNGIELEYDTFGSPSDEPLVLVMGLGAQMILWDEAFCAELVERGFFVVRFDNRDIGLSTHLHDLPSPNLIQVVAAALTGRKFKAPYLLRDMAADTAGLIRALGLDSAHVVGASMGGMIAQTLAVQHPTLVRSLTSIMSTPGDADLPRPTTRALTALARPIPRARDKAIERTVKLFRTIGSPGFPFEEDLVRDVATRSFDRSFDRKGVARQMAAIIASGGRRAVLAAVNAPTLVIHGDADPLVPPQCGVATADAIREAELLMINGMGHDLPRAKWKTMIDGIAGLTERYHKGNAQRSG